MTNAYMNWSGGKDSALSLHRVLKAGVYRVENLLTNINAVYDRVSMHGVRRQLMLAQAAAIGIPLRTILLPEQPGMEEYEESVRREVTIQKENGCHHAIFGDIFLEDLKTYRERRLEELSVQCVFPLWKIPSVRLMEEFIDLGFKGIIVCVNSRWLDKDFCGRLIDASFLRDLPADVDPCGENGEYHSFVFDGPIFQHPVAFQKGEIVYKEYKAPDASPDMASARPAGFFFLDLLTT